MSDGLLLLTGGPAGPVGRLLAEGQEPAAEAMLLKLASLFPGRLYVELMRHGMADEERIESDADRSRLSRTICRWSPPTTRSSPIRVTTRRTTSLLCIEQGDGGRAIRTAAA